MKRIISPVLLAGLPVNYFKCILNDEKTHSGGKKYYLLPVKKIVTGPL